MSNKDRTCAKCLVKGSEEITLHRFPRPGKKNNERVQAWAKFCYPDEDWTSDASLEKLYKQHKLICSKHFSNEYYFMESTTAKRRLNKYAIPSDINNQLETEQSTSDNDLAIESSTPPPSNYKSLSKDIAKCKFMELSPMKRKLYASCRRKLTEIIRIRTKFKILKRKYKRRAILEELASNVKLDRMLKRKIPGYLALMLQSQLINAPRKLNGHNWQTDDKILALGIYNKSATCYRLLRRLFCLPSPNTLKGLLKKVSLHCGINPKIFDTIKRITAYSAVEENLCMIAFGVMSISKNITYNPKLDEIEGYQDHGVNLGRSKEVASHALMFMAIGLKKKWKQPLAFYFSGDSVMADRLKVLIKEVLTESFRAGLIVVGTVCDLDAVNIKALNLLGSSTQKPHFEFNGRNLVTIIDPPHLLKSFRDMFMTYDIECKDDKLGRGVAKWSHIKEFFEKDRANLTFVYAPALTEQHLEPNKKQKIMVYLAAQVFSHSVASGLYAKTNELPPGATTTAMVVNKMDQLFDCLNGDKPDPKYENKYLTNMTRRSPHLKYLQEMKYFFSELKFLGSYIKPVLRDGWIRTLNAVVMLHENLKKMKIKSFPTKQINKDPLENCFDCIRNNSGYKLKPNTVQFVSALKTSILNNLKKSGRVRNCEIDNNVIFDNLKSFVSKKNDIHVVKKCYETNNDCIENIPQQWIHSALTADVKTCTYVSAYIYKKLGSNCDLCKSAMLEENMNDRQIMMEYLNAQHGNDKSSCSVKYEFIETVEHCATMANSFLSTDSSCTEIKKKLYAQLSTASFEWLSMCQSHYHYNVKHIINCVISICIKRFCAIENRKFKDEAHLNSQNENLTN